MGETENIITPDEFHIASGARYGLLIGRLTVENLELNKLLAAEQAKTAQAEADQAERERQNSQLITGAVSYENRIHELEKELEVRPTFEQIGVYETTIEALEIKIGELVSAGPTLAQSAAADAIKTEARNEKAAPVEAA